MKIKVVIGGSQKDDKALYFTYSGIMGLGVERHIALYFPSTNTLEVHSGCAKYLPKILKSLRKYIDKFSYGSLNFGHKPVNVVLVIER